MRQLALAHDDIVADAPAKLDDEARALIVMSDFVIFPTERTTEDPKGEVQHLERGQEPTPITGTVMTWQYSQKDDSRYLEHIWNQTNVAAAIKVGKMIGASNLGPLIQAMDDPVHFGMRQPKLLECHPIAPSRQVQSWFSDHDFGARARLPLLGTGTRVRRRTVFVGLRQLI